MQLPTPDDCMATSVRAPASQQPVAMPMPSCSVERVTNLTRLLASINCKSCVKPPSGIVQTVVILRAIMARKTSSDQLQDPRTQDNSPLPEPTGCAVRQFAPTAPATAMGQYRARAP